MAIPMCKKMKTIVEKSNHLLDDVKDRQIKYGLKYWKAIYLKSYLSQLNI